MLRIRRPDGSLEALSKHAPPLRLKTFVYGSSSIQNSSCLPSEVFGHVLQFLDPTSDWVSFESVCRYWRAVIRIYWRTSHIPRSLAVATNQMRQKWSKLEGFVHRQCAFRDPVSSKDLKDLKTSLSPRLLPKSFEASLRIHDGEEDYGSMLSTGRNSGPGKGLYLGSRLLSTREILSLWVESSPHSRQRTSTDQTVYLPLTTELPGAPRRVAMELHLPSYNTYRGSTGAAQHGQIVLVSSAAPSAPHFKVLARNWSSFLTLV